MTMQLRKELDDEAKGYFSEEQLHCIDPENQPKHLAIIMDGNRRWARRQGKEAMSGHWEGVESLMKVAESSIELGIKTMTVFAFSTENWRRSRAEVDCLMMLFEAYLKRERKNMLDKGVRFSTIGDLSPFPASVLEEIHETQRATSRCEEVNLVVALNYGGRNDILRATQKILADHEKGLVKAEDLSEECFASYLDTHPWGDPDLLIRTSGESRISNFLLWQISYTEVLFTEVLWPDFTAQHLFEAVIEYQNREKRRGL